MGRPYDAKAVANLLLDWSDDENIPVTPMKLQKLIYFCHADFLIFTSKGLVQQEFEAWDYGPVIPYVFSEFKSFSKMPITSRSKRFDPVLAKVVYAACDLEAEDSALLRRLFDFYKLTTATGLSDLSHVASGPWSTARRLYEAGRNADRRISDELINSFHTPSLRS